MLRKVLIRIEGLECSSCVVDLEDALEESGIVKACRVSYVKSRAEVEFDSEKVGDEEIVELISNTGYNASILP